MQRGPGWSGVILVSLIISLAVAFGTYWATDTGLLPAAGVKRAPPEPATVAVPSLEGMSLSGASELLQARGLTVVVREKQPHATLAVDSVIAQDPLPGSVLAARSPVAVTLSSGKSNETMVPELAGRSFEEAVRALQDAGLKVGALSGPESGERKIESTDPPARSLVQLETPVALKLVAVGIEVPKLVGLRFGKAKQTLEEAGFTLGKVRDRYDDYGAPLVVLGQTPAAGATAPKGTAIDILRNAGD